MAKIAKTKPQTLNGQILQDRPYQPKIVSNLKAEWSNNDIFDIKAGAGAGKTYIFQMITDEFKDIDIIMTTPRINLTHQTRKYNKEWGVRQGSISINANNRVVIWNYQTMLNEFAKSPKNLFRDVKLFVIDEAHMLAQSKHIVKSMQNVVDTGIKMGVKFVGMSATLYDKNNMPLPVWQNATPLMPEEWVPPMRLVEAGFLVPLLIKKMGEANRDLLKMGKEDYTEKSKEEAVNEAGIDIVQGLVDHAVGFTIVSSSSIDHAEGLYKDMVSRGYKCGLYVTGKRGDDKALEKFENKEIDYIFTVDKISVGTSINHAQTFALASPIGTFSALVQKCWRVGRLDDNIDKKYGLILDFYGSVEYLGHPALPPAQLDNDDESKDPYVYCKECGSTTPLETVSIEIDYDYNIQTTSKICLACGHESKKKTFIQVHPCSECDLSFPLKKVYSKSNYAMCDCVHCHKPNQIAKLQIPELVVHVQNRAEAIINIQTLALIKGVDYDLISNFCEFASLEQLSFVLDILGDFKQIYNQDTLNLVVGKIENIKITNPIDKQMKRITGHINRELSDHIGELSAEAQRLVMFQLVEWDKKQDIGDTKKYKSLIKAFLKRTYAKTMR